MSKLYYTEEGRVVPTLCEELTAVRWAQKKMILPKTNHEATVYILARAHQNCQSPLRLLVNGHKVEPIEPLSKGTYAWYDVSVPARWLSDGVNTFEFYTDVHSMTAWSLALEAGQVDPQSAVSDDGGETWRTERMGYLCVVRGEYVVRVRLEEGEDEAPANMSWEVPNHPRVVALRDRLPQQVHTEKTQMGKVRVLSEWLASSWEHTGSNRATQYAPWDAETIVDWGSAQVGHNGERPITMCVHYAVALTSACQALGISARCAAVTGGINSGDGHFISEVWFDDFKKWVMVDPNIDAIFYKGEIPMSLDEIFEAGKDLAPYVQWGSGIAFQRQFPHIRSFIDEKVHTGKCYRYRSFWNHADLLSHPECSPPGHGSLVYCETAFVWDAADKDDLGMFPFFLSQEQRAAAPLQ